jgi:hypothetical protein
MEMVTTNTPERSRENAERITARIHEKFARMTPAMEQLLEARHAIFTLPPTSLEQPHGTYFSSDMPIVDQLYKESSYNTAFFYTDLGLRGQGVVEFHNEREKYDPLPTDDDELLAKKAAYRQEIIKAGIELGFIATHHPNGLTPLDQQLGIETSELPPITETVDAVVVAGAAGLTNAKRLHDTIRNIESGAIKTNRIIFATCDRPVGEAEKARAEAGGFRAGTTEYESVRYTTEDLLGIALNTEYQSPVNYGHDLSAAVIDTEVVIGDNPLTLSIVSAPFNPERLVNGHPANRANTEETFRAASDLLRPGNGTIVIESHDAWVPYQELIGEKVFGLGLGKDVIGTGPYNSDRLVTTNDGRLDIRAAECVIDEIAKSYLMLTDVLVAAANAAHQN